MPDARSTSENTKTEATTTRHHGRRLLIRANTFYHRETLQEMGFSDRMLTRFKNGGMIVTPWLRSWGVMGYEFQRWLSTEAKPGNEDRRGRPKKSK